MHANVGNDNEDPAKDGKANDIIPQCQVVESEGTQDTCARYFDVETIPMVFQSELRYFVDDKSFVCIVEYRELYEVSRAIQRDKWVGRTHHLQPLRHGLRRIMIQI